MTQQEQEFVNWLKDYGRLHGSELEEFLGVSDCTIRAIRASLQRQGVMVCSDITGYWLTEDATEWQENMYQNLGSRAKSMFYTMHKGVRQKILSEIMEIDFDKETVNA